MRTLKTAFNAAQTTMTPERLATELAWTCLFVADNRPLCIIGEVKRCGAKDLNRQAVDQVTEYRDKIWQFWSEDEVQRYREFAKAACSRFRVDTR